MQMIKTMPEQYGPDSSRQVRQQHMGLPFRANPVSHLRIHAVIINQPEPAQHIKGMWLNTRLLFSRVAQSFRLMVGVRDYQVYRAHMLQHHSGQQPMTEKEFYRYCVDARYGGKAGKLNKCLC